MRSRLQRSGALLPRFYALRAADFSLKRWKHRSIFFAKGFGPSGLTSFVFLRSSPDVKRHRRIPCEGVDRFYRPLPITVMKPSWSPGFSYARNWLQPVTSLLAIPLRSLFILVAHRTATGRAYSHAAVMQPCVYRVSLSLGFVGVCRAWVRLSRKKELTPCIRHGADDSRGKRAPARHVDGT